MYSNCDFVAILGPINRPNLGDFDNMGMHETCEAYRTFDFFRITSSITDLSWRLSF
jgi:hypothetical protein